MLLMIDNYDSFTYNVVQYLGELGADVAVYRNDESPWKRSRHCNRTRSSSRPDPVRRTRRASPWM